MPKFVVDVQIISRQLGKCIVEAADEKDAMNLFDIGYEVYDVEWQEQDDGYEEAWRARPVEEK